MSEQCRHGVSTRDSYLARECVENDAERPEFSGTYTRGEWVQWGTKIPASVGDKIIELLGPYCEGSHGEASFGRVIKFPDGRYMIIGTTDDDVGDGFTWIMFSGVQRA